MTAQVPQHCLGCTGLQTNYNAWSGSCHAATAHCCRIKEVPPSSETSFPGCRFMAHEPDKWDYAAAGVPSALTEEMEAQQQAKQVGFNAVQLCYQDNSSLLPDNVPPLLDDLACTALCACCYMRSVNLAWLPLRFRVLAAGLHWHSQACQNGCPEAFLA